MNIYIFIKNVNALLNKVLNLHYHWTGKRRDLCRITIWNLTYPIKQCPQVPTHAQTIHGLNSPPSIGHTCTNTTWIKHGTKYLHVHKYHTDLTRSLNIGRCTKASWITQVTWVPTLAHSLHLLTEIHCDNRVQNESSAITSCLIRRWNQLN